MKKIMLFSMVFLLVMPLVISEVYMKPDDIKFREGGVSRFNEYSYDPRIQYKKLETWVYLTPPEPPVFAKGFPPYYPKGTAKLLSVRSAYEPSGQAIISVKDLRPSGQDHTYYQAWLYDADSGYHLNLGLFEAFPGGIGSIEYFGAQYFDEYDFVMITREPRFDMDPRPSGDIALVGKIQQKQYYEPLPLLGARESYGYTYYGE